MIKTIGGEAGRDYATIALFNSAWGNDPQLPTTQVENVEARIYGANADGSIGQYATCTTPTVTANNFTLTYRGMLGSMSSGGQVKIVGSTHGIYSGFNVYNGGTLIIDNISATGNNGHGIYSRATATRIQNCQGITLGGAGLAGIAVSYYPCVIMNCFCYGATATSAGIGSGGQSPYNQRIYNSIISAPLNVGISYGTAYPVFDSCTVYGKYAILDFGTIHSYVPFAPLAKNCIFYTTDSFSPNSGAADATDIRLHIALQNFSGCNIISAAGKFYGGLSLANWIAGCPETAQWYVDTKIISTDPLFVNASGTFANFADFALSANSPCRRLNQTLGASPLIATDFNERVTIGALSGFDEDPLSESLVLYPTTYGNGKTGRWRDVEDESDVRLDVQWGVDGTSRTGTLDLNADAPTVPTLTVVDDGDETATATISGADDGTTNTVYYAEFGTDAWLEAGSVVGNGTVALDLGAGAFSLQVQSKLGAGCSATTPVLFRIKPTDGEAAIITAAEDIKNALIAESFSQTFTPMRVYIDEVEGDDVKTLSVFIQPAELEIENGTRTKDQITSQVDIGVFNYCETLAENDAMLQLTEEIYRAMRHRTLTEGRKVVEISSPVLFNPATLRGGNVFMALMVVTVRGME
jgi:hypothetical protein